MTTKRRTSTRAGRLRVGTALVAVLGLLAAACGAPGGDEELSGEDLSDDAATDPDEDGSEDDSEDGSEDDDAAPDDAPDDAITIGFLSPTTGGLAASGEDMLRGWELYWDLHGTQIAGREIRLIHEDTAGDPAIGLNRARRLVEDEGASLIVGPLLANVGLAVAEYLSEQGVPNFQPVSSADDLTQRQRLPNVLRVGGWTSSQTTHPFGQWAYDQGYRRIVTLCQDYAFGHENCGGFVNTFTDNGGEIIEQIWNPLGTQDFGTYMAQIQAADDADAVFVQQVGADSPRFVEAWASFGMVDELPLLGAETLLDQAFLRGMGDEAVGLISTGKFAEGRDEASTQEFVDAFLEAYDLLPSYYASTSYIAAQWTAQALEEIDADIEDLDRFLDAVRTLEFESPGGPQQLDDYDNPIQNVYIREVQRRDDGLLWNVPVETIESVSQFWTYDPEEFLSCPVYSRSYQGDGPFPAC